MIIIVPSEEEGSVGFEAEAYRQLRRAFDSL
jgi:hypothetical protein